jgi:hypothetical protein
VSHLHRGGLTGAFTLTFPPPASAQEFFRAKTAVTKPDRTRYRDTSVEWQRAQKLNHSHGPIPSQLLARYPAVPPVAVGRPRNHPTERSRVQPKPVPPARAVPQGAPSPTRVFVRLSSGLPKAFKAGTPHEEFEKLLLPRRSPLRLPPGVSSSLHRRGDTNAFFLTFSSHEEALTFTTRKVSDLRALGTRCRDTSTHWARTRDSRRPQRTEQAATRHPLPAPAAPLESSQDPGTWPAAPREQSCPLVSPQPARVREGVSRSSLPLRATVPNRGRRVPPRAQAWSQEGCHSRAACRGGAQGGRHARC